MKKLLSDKVFLTVLVCLCITFMMICMVLIVLSERGKLTPPPTPTPSASPAPTPTALPTPRPTPTPVPTPTPTPYDPPEELLASREINPHVIGWLDIPGTEISYPILQHPTQDNYYLDITLEGGYGYPGSIYTNSMEGQDFDTFNTVLYGHNMANETYFGSLKYFNDEDFRASHREIDVYTLKTKHVYDLFAVVTYDDRYITQRYDDEKPEDRMAFLRSLMDFGPVVFNDVSVGPESHILTLSTCIGGMPNNRLLVLAVRREPAPPVQTQTPSPLPVEAAAPKQASSEAFEGGKVRKN